MVFPVSTCTLVLSGSELDQLWRLVEPLELRRQHSGVVQVGLNHLLWSLHMRFYPEFPPNVPRSASLFLLLCRCSRLALQLHTFTAVTFLPLKPAAGTSRCCFCGFGCDSCLYLSLAPSLISCNWTYQRVHIWTTSGHQVDRNEGS